MVSKEIVSEKEFKIKEDSVQIFPIFSQTFHSLGNVFQIEFIDSDNNQTTVYGPDFSDPITGVYHIQTPLEDGSYTIRTEISKIGNDVPEQKIVDEFKGRVVS